MSHMAEEYIALTTHFDYSISWSYSGVIQPIRAGAGAPTNDGPVPGPSGLILVGQVLRDGGGGGPVVDPKLTENPGDVVLGGAGTDK